MDLDDNEIVDNSLTEDFSDNSCDKEAEVDTRLIAMGSRPLMEGFSLLGFETWPKANEKDLEELLLQLKDSGDKAFILLESYLSQSETPLLSEIRERGGQIIITEIPAINGASDYHPYVEDLIINNLKLRKS